jgi:hypothetical protein
MNCGAIKNSSDSKDFLKHTAEIRDFVSGMPTPLHLPGLLL